jgi:hypothetical protein
MFAKAVVCRSSRYFLSKNGRFRLHGHGFNASVQRTGPESEAAIESLRGQAVESAGFEHCEWRGTEK